MIVGARKDICGIFEDYLRNAFLYFGRFLLILHGSSDGLVLGLRDIELLGFSAESS